ncbi:BZ3500_MvSof-1268-A1-R1_Chr5-3g08238 [Microbotryum saponariae]|uniref:BZ3500_MvSof-1268-A1-R1_Chr5-3g08238 protein n=1 Tax=Microbotryum saponariae TaxID=289078 RepID=A0A2X0KLD5_9BASI|nr:BZ3500_MvSof-1268-A1-R1_Chr5-3g08238 [Microbotryum saponariae]SDA08346.1 BZ3501_MvSof-1269-A2-R1_Chr5-3g07966 [Microbotryum saponariae]
MSGAARLGLADIAHRTLVTGLAGLSVCTSSHPRGASGTGASMTLSYWLTRHLIPTTSGASDGLYGMYRIHTHTMQAGEEAWKKHLDDEAKVKSGSAFVADDGSHSSAPPATTSEIPRHRF